MQTPQMTAARAKGRGPHTYQSAVSTIDVRARPDVVYKLLLNYVWKQGAGQHPVAVTVQGDKYGEGCTRVVNGAVEEVVISAVPYSRIEYVIVGGPFPITSHKATVVIDNLGNGSSRVTWSFEFTPSFSLFGPLVSFGLTHLVIKRYLQAIADEAVKPQPPAKL